MTHSKGKCNTVWTLMKPLVVGLMAAFAVTLLLMAGVSLVFSILESISDSAILPLALMVAGVGCFIGSYICAAIMGSRGLICGAIIGTMMFTVIWVISVLCSKPVFGTENIVKIALLVMTGCGGGWLGGQRRLRRR